MYNFVVIIHVIICILLIAIVLFQAGKTLGLGGLGGGSSDAVFTSAGGNDLIKKITAVLAVLFLITSLTLTFVVSKRPSASLMDILPPTPNLNEDAIGKELQKEVEKIEDTTTDTQKSE